MFPVSSIFFQSSRIFFRCLLVKWCVQDVNVGVYDKTVKNFTIELITKHAWCLFGAEDRGYTWYQ